jgi:hypothetical protein
MHTKDKLAAALREVGLNKMADKAAEGYYHDFLSPLATPTMQLVNDLAGAAKATNNVALSGKIIALREDVMLGLHDASKEESDAWADSDEGRAAFAALTGKPGAF